MISSFIIVTLSVSCDNGFSDTCFLIWFSSSHTLERTFHHLEFLSSLLIHPENFSEAVAVAVLSSHACFQYLLTGPLFNLLERFCNAHTKKPRWPLWLEEIVSAVGTISHRRNKKAEKRRKPIKSDFTGEIVKKLMDGFFDRHELAIKGGTGACLQID